MEAIACQALADYYALLTADASGQEFAELLKLLTTTETYFFRNRQQLQSFEEEVLPAVLKRKHAAGLSALHFWSAGCSSGEEPYTLAMQLLETIPDIQRWKISIVGTDINTQVLERAKEGVYAARALRDTPPKYKTKYFTREHEKYCLNDQVKQMVSFRPGNLLNEHDTALLQQLDCIFCRNVLIYFDLESSKTVVNRFYDSLARNSYLFLGHSESLFRITTIFKLVRLEHSLVYYKE